MPPSRPPARTPARTPARPPARTPALTPPPSFYFPLNPQNPKQQALKHEPDTVLTDTGALAALSGAKTGRSPKDKRIVNEPTTSADVWWAGGGGASGGAGGSPNFQMDER